MDENKAKEDWKKMQASMKENIPGNDLPAIFTFQRKTALMQLADRYKRFMIMSVALAIMSALQIPVSDIEPIFTLPLCIYMICFFLTCTSLDYYLYSKVSDINPLTMPTLEVIERSHNCRKFHLQCIAVLLPLALIFVGWVVWNAWTIANNEYFLMGISAGLIIGVCIGLYKLSQFLKDYRILTEEKD